MGYMGKNELHGSTYTKAVGGLYPHDRGSADTAAHIELHKNLCVNHLNASSLACSAFGANNNMYISAWPSNAIHHFGLTDTAKMTMQHSGKFRLR
jgi:hypothetical protein